MTTCFLYCAAALLAAAAWLLIATVAGGSVARRAEQRFANLEFVSHHMDGVEAEVRRAWISRGLSRYLDRAGLHLEPVQLWLLLAALVSVIGGVSWFWSWKIAIIGTLLVGLITIRIIQSATARRQEHFLTSLPGLLDHMRQGVASGNGTVSSFSRALAAGPEICRAFLQPAVTRVQMGMGLPEAVQIQAERLALKEVSILSIILQTHQRYGGSLYESLGSLIDVLRARERARREFVAISSEIRSSARFLMLLPVLVSAVILVAQPRHFDFFFEGAGQYVGLAVVGLMVCGFIVVRRLAAIRY